MKLVYFKEGKKMGKKKKIFVLIGMVGLLVLTGYLNIKLNQKPVTTSTTTTVTSANFFMTYRTDRQATRDREIEVLDAIIASSATTADARTVANEKRMFLLEQMEKELVLEGLIKSQGFNDAIVTTTTENYNIIVKVGESGELSSSDVAKLLDLIISETKCSATNVKIIPIE